MAPVTMPVTSENLLRAAAPVTMRATSENLLRAAAPLTMPATSENLLRAAAPLTMPATSENLLRAASPMAAQSFPPLNVLETAGAACMSQNIMSNASPQAGSHVPATQNETTMRSYFPEDDIEPLGNLTVNMQRTFTNHSISTDSQTTDESPSFESLSPQMTISPVEAPYCSLASTLVKAYRLIREHPELNTLWTPSNRLAFRNGCSPTARAPKTVGGSPWFPTRAQR
jgi:hypothetical protein